MSTPFSLADIFQWQVRVYYEDTDAGGIVYHANYLKFFERTRTEWLRNLGFDQLVLREQQRLIFVVKHINIDYLKSALFNDALTVTCQLVHLKKVSMDLQQIILRDDKPLCKATVKIACVNYDSQRPQVFPDSLAKKLEHYVARGTA